MNGNSQGRSSVPPSSIEEPKSPSIATDRGPLLVVVCGLLPGLLAGTQIAGLLFFLNPDLPFATGPLLRAVLVYGGLLALASLLLHLPWSWGRPQRARRILPWSLTLVLASAAVLDWTHASHYTYYLPGGINVRLIKAAVFLSVAALIGFYTALLHASQRRRYRFQSQAAIAVLCLVSVYVMIERRDAFQPELRPEPRSSKVASSQRPRLLVVGIDNATLDAVLPLAEQGKLPFFAKLLEEGTAARLRSFTPAREIPLWTTLATGTLPYRHGIVSSWVYSADIIEQGGLFRLLPAGLEFEHWGTLGSTGRHADATLRRKIALWEILARLEVPSAVVGWPLTAPVSSEIRVALADELFAGRLGERYGKPDDVAERARVFRVRVDDLDPALRSRFGARAKRKVLEGVAQDQWRASLSLYLIEQDPEIRALFVRLPGLRGASRTAFGGWAAREFEGSQSASHEQASHLLESYYITLDNHLARLWEKIEGPRLLAVVSTHGVEGPGQWQRWWRKATLRDPLQGQVDGAPDGILLLTGEGIAAGVRLDEARLVDLVPTLLYGMGFPVARDLAGRVLTDAFLPSFLAKHPLTFVPSFETLARRQPVPRPPIPLEEP